MRGLASRPYLTAAILGTAAFLAAFGVALAVTVVQVSRGVPSTLVLAQVLADENLGLYHDPEATQPVTSLEFTGLQPPLRSGVIETIYVRNESGIDLTLIEPCRGVFEGDDEQNGIRIGFLDSAISSLDGVELGGFCDRRAILAPDEVVRVELRLVDLDPGLEAGSYSFTTVFGAIGSTGDQAAPKPIPPPEGMVGWWPGDGNANDIIGGNDGTLTGDAIFAPGMVDQGFSLDGTGDFVVVPDSPNLNITGDVTVDLWARRAVFGTPSPAMALTKGANSLGGADAPTAFFLGFSSSDEVIGGFERADGSNAVLTGPVVADTSFHHYAYVRSGDAHNLFVDGVIATGDSFTGRPGNTSEIPLAIGAWADETGFLSFFGGVIDEVEIFDRALSEAEIRAIYEAGSAGKIKPPPVLFVGRGPNGEPSDFDIDGDGDIDDDDQIIIKIDQAMFPGSNFDVDLNLGGGQQVVGGFAIAYTVMTGDPTRFLPIVDRNFDGAITLTDLTVALANTTPTTGDTYNIGPTQVVLTDLFADPAQMRFQTRATIQPGSRFALRWATPRGP